MQHNASHVTIYFTKDYSRFETITGNRLVNDLKIKRIIKDIDEGLDVLRYCPILVNEKNDKLRIIDGQHRFKVSKILKTGVWYIIAEKIELIEIAKINSNTDKWKDHDFINCYVKQGNEHYVTLKKFIDSYGFPIGVSLQMLSKGYLIADGGGTGNTKHRFRNGEFKVSEEDKAHELANTIKLFKDFPQHTSGGFVEAIGRIIRNDKIRIEDLLKKFQKDISKLYPCKNAKEYLALLENIYNTGNRSRQIIY